MLGVEQRTLSRLIGTAAIDTHARELRLALSDQAIADIIRSRPGVPGRDRQVLDATPSAACLRQNGISRGPLSGLAAQGGGARPADRHAARRGLAAPAADRPAASLSRGDARHRVLHARLRQARQGRRAGRGQAQGVLRAEQAPVHDAGAAQGQRAAAHARRRQGAAARQRGGDQGRLRAGQGEVQHPREAARAAAVVPRQGGGGEGLRGAGEGRQLRRSRRQARVQGERFRSRPARRART